MKPDPSFNVELPGQFTRSYPSHEEYEGSTLREVVPINDSITMHLLEPFDYAFSQHKWKIVKGQNHIPTYIFETLDN